MREVAWRALAWLVSRQPVFEWLRRRAQATPYSHIASTAPGMTADLYMWRGWVFNAYGKDAAGETTSERWAWLPSVRMHHILRPDQDRHLHDHPWNARTIVLQGEYTEERPGDTFNQGDDFRAFKDENGWPIYREVFYRRQGYTGRLLFGQYHRISQVPPEGVWTLFFTWRKRGTWGFDVNGVKVPWREYLRLR